MRRSWRIGTAFGIGLYIHWSFLVIPALIAFANLDHPLSAALGVGLILALFGCVVLHELGHALMARTFGIGTRDITLYPIGGVARLERMSDHPGEELAIAIAGPLVNVVIAAGLWLGMSLAGIPPELSRLWNEGSVPVTSVVEFILLTLWQANIVLVLFNLVPAFPMDGGRVLRALLAMVLGRLRATEIAAVVAKVAAAVFVLSGLTGYFPGTGIEASPFLAVIGLFILFVGQQELAMVRYQDYARRHGLPTDRVPPVMPDGQEPLTVLPADEVEATARPVEAGFNGFTWDRRVGMWIEWRNGRPVGAVSVGPSHAPW